MPGFFWRFSHYFFKIDLLFTDTHFVRPLSSGEKRIFNLFGLTLMVLAIDSYLKDGKIFGPLILGLFSPVLFIAAARGRALEHGDSPPSLSEGIDKTPSWLKFVSRVLLAIASLGGKMILALALALHPDRITSQTSVSHWSYLFNFLFVWIGVALSRNPVRTLVSFVALLNPRTDDFNRKRGLTVNFDRLAFDSLFRAVATYAFATALFHFAPKFLHLSGDKLYCFALGVGVLFSWRISTRKLALEQESEREKAA